MRLFKPIGPTFWFTLHLYLSLQRKFISNCFCWGVCFLRKKRRKNNSINSQWCTAWDIAFFSRYYIRNTRWEIDSLSDRFFFFFNPFWKLSPWYFYYEGIPKQGPPLFKDHSHWTSRVVWLILHRFLLYSHHCQLDQQYWASWSMTCTKDGWRCCNCLLLFAQQCNPSFLQGVI